MVLGFTTIYAIVAYHHWSCDFQSRSWRSVLDTTVCYLRQVGGFLQVLPVSTTSTSDRHWNIVESGVKHHKAVLCWREDKIKQYKRV